MSIHMAVLILQDLLYGNTWHVKTYGSTPQVGFTNMEILSMLILSMLIQKAVPHLWDLLLWRYLVCLYIWQ